MPIVILLVIIILILLGGGGIILGGIYAAFVLAWAAAPWAAALIAFAFLAMLMTSLVKARAKLAQTSSHEADDRPHPDGATPAEIKAATERNERLNAAYRAKIEQARGHRDGD